jgi:exonuclease III
MSLFSVNCRGVGNASTVRELKDFVVKFAPSILCIQETQISRTHLEALASTFGFDHAFAIDSDGRSGGLGIYWNNDINIDVLGYSHYHTDVFVPGIGEIPWRLT